MRFTNIICLWAGLIATATAVPLSGVSSGTDVDISNPDVSQSGAEGVLDARAKKGQKATTTAAAASQSTTVAAANAAAASNTVINPQFDAAAASSAASSAAAQATTLAKGATELKVAQLVMAASAVQKLDILSSDSDYLFDFNKEAAGANGDGGTIVTANLASFPVTQMSGTSAAIGEMSPCGFATPHSHPRANELNLIMKGTVVSSMTLENNARVINQTLQERQMTIFPQGSMHMEFNAGCSNATFVAFFSNADAGVQQSMNVFTNFGDDVIRATVGGSLNVDGKDVDTFKKIIPVNMANGVESCLATCGIKKRSFDETMQVLKRGLAQRAVPVNTGSLDFEMKF